MEIQSSSIHIIIAVLVLVSIGFIVYMNYNEITLLKNKLSKALSDISENNRKIEEFTSNYSYSTENLEGTEGEEVEMEECYDEDQEGICVEEAGHQEEYIEEVQENSEVIQEETIEPGNLFGEWNTSAPPPVSYVLGRSVSFKIDESPEQEETLEQSEIQEIEEGSNAFGLSPSYSGCQQILKSGKNAGELCEKKVYIGSLCKQHYAKNQ